ncbi:hypothetical protein HK101_000939 [Irineochytrium annulatum]|nr:hypothetical protein HK101_000939 [Irineochytrium annulatum]
MSSENQDAVLQVVFAYKLGRLAPSTQDAAIALEICEKGTLTARWPAGASLGNIPTVYLLAFLLPAAASSIDGTAEKLSVAEYLTLIARGMRRFVLDLDARLVATAARVAAAAATGRPLDLVDLADVVTLRAAAQISVIDTFETPSSYFDNLVQHLEVPGPSAVKDALLLAHAIRVKLELWSSTGPARELDRRREKENKKSVAKRKKEREAENENEGTVETVKGDEGEENAKKGARKKRATFNNVTNIVGKQ